MILHAFRRMRTAWGCAKSRRAAVIPTGASERAAIFIGLVQHKNGFDRGLVDAHAAVVHEGQVIRSIYVSELDSIAEARFGVGILLRVVMHLPTTI